MTHELHSRVGDKEVYLAREHIKHVKMIADLTKNALQQQTSTKQEMRRFSMKYLDILYPELFFYSPEVKSFIRLTQSSLLYHHFRLASVSVIKFVFFFPRHQFSSLPTTSSSFYRTRIFSLSVQQ